MLQLPKITHKKTMNKIKTLGKNRRCCETIKGEFLLPQKENIVLKGRRVSLISRVRQSVWPNKAVDTQ